MSAPVMLGVTASILAIGLPVITASGYLSQKQAAAKTADAAALAAADAMLGWINEEPCALADRLVTVNGFSLSACELQTTEVVITINFGSFNSTVSARAGSVSPTIP